MCGILGVAGTDVDVAVHARIESALDALDHRGPDARAVRSLRGHSLGIVLGHTRLRIIDLSLEADQPLPNEDETVWVTYNGELYNDPELRAPLAADGHGFRSASDTELLVHLFEEHRDDPFAMLDRLRGMFAFAIADTERDQVFLARGRIGIKPLYWTETLGGVAWSSEVRALAAAGFGTLRVRADAIGDFIYWGHTRTGSALCDGINELQPGHALLLRDGKVDVRRWWRPEPAPDVSVGEEATRLVRATLREGVRRHLVADRSVGVFLSGGVDSAAIAASAASQGAVRTFTVSFPDVAGDESGAAAITAARLGTRHSTVPVTGAEIASELPRIVSDMDRPTADGVNTWIVSRAARHDGLVVALSGVGGDELFGGYPSFVRVPRLARMPLSVVPSSWRAKAAVAAGRRSPGGRASRVLDAGGGYGAAYAAVRGQFSASELRAAGFTGSFASRVQDDRPDVPPGDRVMLLEMSNYMLEQLLLDTDQMSMAHSLEVRVPLLDDVLVRVALALPADVRLREGKALLAAAAGVPKAPKQPFALPFGSWMLGPLREQVREGLLSSALPLDEQIPVAFRQRLWESFEAGRTHWSRPWSVVVLRMWTQIRNADVV